MDSNYKSELKNSNMKRRLLVAENIPTIESLLDKESQRLERLQKLKKDKKLNFGEKVYEVELKDIFPDICTKVNEFLGVSERDFPNFEYYNLMKPGLFTTPILSAYAFSGIYVASKLSSFFTNQTPDINYLLEAGAGSILFVQTAFFHSMLKNPKYNRLSKDITLRKVTRPELIPTLGHEYTHRLQDNKGFASNKYSIFLEGHARGVQKYLAEYYQKREDNEAFLYSSLDETVGEFKITYLWMCKKLSQKPKKSLLKTKTSRDLNEGLNLFGFIKPSPHAIGNTLFSIYESQNGREIYNQMIHGSFKFT